MYFYRTFTKKHCLALSQEATVLSERFVPCTTTARHNRCHSSHTKQQNLPDRRRRRRSSSSSSISSSSSSSSLAAAAAAATTGH